MTLMNGSRRRQLMRGLALAGVAAAGYAFGITSDRVAAGPPAAAPGVLPAAGPPAPPPDRRVVAFIYGNVPVTREEFGDFLIARGGYEKLELMVNKKIIEVEAARRGVTVTSTEIRAGLDDDLHGLGVKKDDFVKQILPRYNKTLFEWTEDVIKPRLLLSKMCRDRVKVTDEELRRAFENKYGEKRQARVICWAKEDERAALAQWSQASKSDEEFLRVAKMQADRNLAAAGGLTAPVGRYTDAQDGTVEKALWTLKVGEMSQLIPVAAGIMCVKLVAVLPPDPNVKFEDKKPVLHKEVFDKRLAQEIPKFFGELKSVAKPNLLLQRPTTEAEFREGVDHIINQVGGVPGVPPPPPPPAPAPKKP